MAQDGRSWLDNSGGPVPGNVDGKVDFDPAMRVVQKDPAATVSKGQALALEPGKLFVMLADGVTAVLIPMAMGGLHELPKVDAAVIAAGEDVYWDESVDKVDDDAATPATGDFKCGIAAEGKGATTDETIAVWINTGTQPTVT